MATDAGQRGGLGAAARVVSERVSAIVRLELQLAAAELKQKAQTLGTGVGLLIGAAIFVLFAVGFLLATAAAGLALVVPTWLALLIVAGAVLLLAAALAAIGISLLQRVPPPMPSQALEEAKLTTEALKNGHN